MKVYIITILICIEVYVVYFSIGVINFIILGLLTSQVMRMDVKRSFIFFCAQSFRLLALLFAIAKKVTKISLRLRFSAICFRQKD